jgi:DNA-binding response OmpR family regulator
MLRVVVVGGSPELVATLSANLQSGWPSLHVFRYPDCDTALNAAFPEAVDVVFVCPDGELESWLQFVAAVRSAVSGALVFVSQASRAHDCVRAFEAGADDCVAEARLDIDLVSRLQAILRRTCVGRETCHHCGLVCINTATHKVKVADHHVHLTPHEYRLLEALYRQPRVAVSREELVLRAYGPEYRGDWDLLRKCVLRLRRKVEPYARVGSPLILNERGVGYLLADGYDHDDDEAARAVEPLLVGNSSVAGSRPFPRLSRSLPWPM